MQAQALCLKAGSLKKQMKPSLMAITICYLLSCIATQITKQKYRMHPQSRHNEKRTLGSPSLFAAA
eukprot:1139845-Pelagomonas_calceolata.AAC.1